MTELDDAVKRLAAIPPRTQCDRAELVIQRGLAQNWITFNTSTAHAQVHATLRIALNMEVEAGGPYAAEQEVRGHGKN